MVEEDVDFDGEAVGNTALLNVLALAIETQAPIFFTKKKRKSFFFFILFFFSLLVFRFLKLGI